MKNLLITIAAFALIGCGESQQVTSTLEKKPVDPEAEANKLFTEASQLVKKADAISEPYSLEAFNNRKAAIEILEKIPVQYPQSSISVKISEGDYKIQNQSIKEITEKIKAPEISIQKAVSYGDVDCLKIHLAAGTDINSKSNDDGHFEGGTPLHYACLMLNKEIIKILIANNADVNLISGIGMTSLDAAIERRDFYKNTRLLGLRNPDNVLEAEEIIELLHNYGAKTAEELKSKQN